MKTGIFGGTFNPVHIGHTEAARKLLELKILDRIIFVPTGDPPHKTLSGASARDRYNMVRLAADHPQMYVSDVELKRTGKCYTVDTMEYFKACLPNDELCFISGADSFISMPYWKNPEKLFSDFCFITVDRQSAFNSTEYMMKSEEIIKKYNAKVTMVNINTPVVASTDLRTAAQNGKDIKSLVPLNVYEYIRENRLYRKEAEIDVQKIREFAKNSLSEKRFKHSEGVAKCAKMLADCYGADTDYALAAGYLHDIAKEISLEEMNELTKHIEIDKRVRISRSLLHGAAGAELAKTELDIPQEIYYACFYHTMGNTNLTLLEKIIFVSDMAEEGRDFPSAALIREEAKTDLDKAAVMCVNSTLKYLIEKGLYIHPDTVKTRNALIEQEERF